MYHILISIKGVYCAKTTDLRWWKVLWYVKFSCFDRAQKYDNQTKKQIDVKAIKTSHIGLAYNVSCGKERMPINDPYQQCGLNPPCKLGDASVPSVGV